MNSKKLFLTSSGLSADMKKKFFDIIGKCPEDVKVLYIPTAGIETDGAREGFAVCFQELSSMGIRYENILVYNLELILSKDYQRTYSTCVTDPYMLTRLLTIEELQSFDAVVVSGGDAAVLCCWKGAYLHISVLRYGAPAFAGALYPSIWCGR